MVDPARTRPYLASSASARALADLKWMRRVLRVALRELGSSACAHVRNWLSEEKMRVPFCEDRAYNQCRSS